MTASGAGGWPDGSFLGMLAAGERAVLLSRGIPVRFTDDEIVVLQGGTGTVMYALTSGLVKVVVAAGNGAETALAMRSRGDLVGEFALVDGKPRTATARAVGPVAAVRVSRGAWEALSGECPALQLKLATYLVAKIRASIERQTADRILEARDRLTRVLYEIAEAYGAREPNGMIRIPITQGELGQFAGVAVSTTERELAELRRRGAVQASYGAIVVCDLALLRAIRFREGNAANPLSKGMSRRLVG